MSGMALLFSIFGLSLLRSDGRWTLWAMGGTALVLLVACFAALGRGFLQEIKKRFYTR